jgi:serine/threonine protein kinase
MGAFDFVLAGRYRLIAPLGEGGMAAVYRARDLRLNREVAVKVLRDELTRDPEFLDRFQREAQFVASLSHPAIVPVYDVGDDRGAHFIVMEYVRGRTLRDQLDIAGPLPADRAVSIMDSVLDALSYAHALGIIHRDIKPHNILLSADSAARLADFGIAHLVDCSSTRTAAILGSAHYLSPEQSRGEEATVASDIYACGIVLYEMLAGHPPFDGPNALAIANHHLHSSPPALSPDVPPRLKAAIDRALCKEPNERFDDAASFASALTTALPDPAATDIQPLPSDATQVLPTAATRSTSPHTATSVEALVLRRSARKTAATGLICAALLAAAADLARLSYQGQTLPNYPSAPYALVPALMAALLILWWFHVRSWSYRMDANAAVLQWGLLTHHRFGVPIRYITTLELKQSPIDRIFGLGTIELCARDQHGNERSLVLEDLPHPRQTYEELMHFLGRTLRRAATSDRAR